jgi:outer membrane lipoprotein-sorting protein
MTDRPNTRSRLVLVSLLATLILATGGAARARGKANALSPAEQEKLDAILAKFDETQSSTRTLTATFTERKEIALLKEPVVAKGRFFYTKPDDVLWQYTEPDPRYFLISKDELLSYFPAKRRAERVSIGLYHDRLLKVLAIGQPSKNLLKYYDIHLDESNGIAGTNLLILTPRKRMVKKRISEVRLWVSKETSLPVRMQYCEPDGDSTTIAFEDIRFNPQIASSVYKIEIPKDVEIKKGFTGMSESKDKDQG